jgi:PilZ domain
MSTPGRAPLRAIVGRRVPRCPLAVPVRITILHPGDAYIMPGRSLDLGEGGIAAVPAGELHAGDSVGIEFLLPDLGLGLQAKAVVRHYGPLRCGLEFQELTRHQQALIREWTRLSLGGRPRPEVSPISANSKGTTPAASNSFSQRLQKFRRLLWWITVALVLAALAAWWYWDRQWRELERPSPNSAGRIERRVVSESALLRWPAQKPALGPSILRPPGSSEKHAG